jgi:hypothetical protein
MMVQWLNCDGAWEPWFAGVDDQWLYEAYPFQDWDWGL